MSNIVLEKLLTIDETGVVKAPTIRQLQDKNFVLSLDDLQQKDYSFEKMYITYGEYYSITHNKSVLVDQSKFYFEKKPGYFALHR